jgi:pilus assembly protein CpaE
VFLTSKTTEADILIRALKAGAKEFFTQPINTAEVMGALLRLREQEIGRISPQAEEKQGKIIVVFGSKGGVGTTTVAVNVATSLMELEGVQSVALIDMNLLFGEIPLFLNMEPVFDWVEVARNISRLDPTYLMSIFTKHSSGIYVLPSPSRIGTDSFITAEVVEQLLKLMESMFDYIVIDSGQSIDDTSMKILEVSDVVLIVGVLSLPCLIKIKRLQETFRMVGYPNDQNIKIVMNRYNRKSDISLKEAEESLKKQIFWTIPNNYLATMSAINQGKPLSAVAGGADISKSFKDLTQTVIGSSEPKKVKKAFWGLM